MKFLSNEIADAYYASPLPLEGSLAESERYSRCLKQLYRELESLRRALSAEDFALVVAYAQNIAEQADMENRFYFQSGWLSARQSTN